VFSVIVPELLPSPHSTKATAAQLHINDIPETGPVGAEGNNTSPPPPSAALVSSMAGKSRSRARGPRGEGSILTLCLE
jgi:hypothetical protein